MNYPHQLHKGFTIVEALVAITILILGITGALTAAATGISASTYAKEDVIAANMAQEAIEQIRNMRDENGIMNQSWLASIADPGSPCEPGRACTVDVNAPPGQPFLVTCPDFGACPVLKRNIDSGAYGYGVGSADPSRWHDTPYTREIDITQPNQEGAFIGVNNQIAITVKITWSHGIVNRQFKVRENLVNWQS